VRSVAEATPFQLVTVLRIISVLPTKPPGLLVSNHHITSASNGIVRTVQVLVEPILRGAGGTLDGEGYRGGAAFTWSVVDTKWLNEKWQVGLLQVLLPAQWSNVT
jgi:hypothetical protein